VTMPAAPAKAPAKGGQAAAQAPASWPFPTGVLRSENPDYDQTKNMAGTAVQMPNYTLEPTGWLRGLEFQVDVVVSGNVTNVVAFSADGPFNAINKITFKDTGNREVFGPMGGYDWMTIDKYGAYYNVGDPRSDLSYTATVGAVGTGGSASFILYLPLELVQRDALGTVENKSDNTAWKAEIWIEGTTVVYPSVAPSTTPTVRIRITEDSYTEPAAVSGGGRPFADTPPRVGTLQYWVQEASAGISGTGSYNLDNGIGYPIRNLIYKLVRNAGTRAQGDADWPDPVTLTYGKVQLFQRYKNLWISKIGRSFGDQTPLSAVAAGVFTYNTDATVGNAQAVGGCRELGVYPVWFTDDFSIQPGSELRNGYLVTKTGTVLKWKGTLVGGNTDIVNVLSNYVIPPNNDYYSLLSGR
jgi:hypothetical protein